jgi:hypothetical protein
MGFFKREDVSQSSHRRAMTEKRPYHVSAEMIPIIAKRCQGRT